MPVHNIHTWELSEHTKVFTCYVCNETRTDPPAVWVEPLTKIPLLIIQELP